MNSHIFAKNFRTSMGAAVPANKGAMHTSENVEERGLYLTSALTSHMCTKFEPLSLSSAIRLL